MCSLKRIFTITSLTIFFLNTRIFAQSDPALFRETSIHFDASLIHLGLSPDDFNSTSIRYTAKDATLHYDGLIILPELKGGYGYNIAFGFHTGYNTSAPKGTYPCWGIEIDYSMTKYNSDWGGLNFPVTCRDIWLVGQYGATYNGGCFLMSGGVLLSSALKIKNGSYRMIDDEPIDDKQDAIFHAGYPSAKFGFDAIFQIYGDISLDLAIAYNFIHYDTVSGIMGDDRDFTKGGIQMLPESVSDSYFSWRIGIRYDLRIF